jgi:hypothetical protein
VIGVAVVKKIASTRRTLCLNACIRRSGPASTSSAVPSADWM